MCISYINIAIVYAYNWLAKMLSVYHIADFVASKIVEKLNMVVVTLNLASMSIHDT